MHRGLMMNRVGIPQPDLAARLQDATVRADRGHMTGRIEEPESLPFADQRPQILRRVKQLLNTSLGASRVDRHEAANRRRQTNDQQSELHKTSHRAFLRERFAIAMNRSVKMCWFVCWFSRYPSDRWDCQSVWCRSDLPNWSVCHHVRLPGFDAPRPRPGHELLLPYVSPA